MPRRAGRSAPTLRIRAASKASTAASSTQTTPASSAYTSANPSEIDTEDELNKSIASLTLDVPLIPLRRERRVPAKPFPFLDLPSELRIKVYEHYFDAEDSEDVLDLAPDNYKRYHKKLGLMRVNRQVHDEATHYFYSSRAFRIFPIHHGRYFKTKRPLLARLKKTQLACINTLELRLGPGWNDPPRGWVVNPALGLQDCTNVRKLTVLVQCDPSDGFFKGFRRSEGFYEAFSSKLMSQVLKELPAVKVIEFDAWQGVRKHGPMMRGLLNVAVQSGRLIAWGPERGWTGTVEDEEVIIEEKNPFLQGLPIGVTSYNTNMLVSA
jgi:hypothetical protein